MSTQSQPTPNKQTRALLASTQTAHSTNRVPQPERKTARALKRKQLHEISSLIDATGALINELQAQIVANKREQILPTARRHRTNIRGAYRHFQDRELKDFVVVNAKSDQATHNNANGQLQDHAPSKASQVFATTELAEMILLNASHNHLRTSLQRVSKDFRNAILGSPNLQRRLHQEPLWSHETVCPAPIPTSMVVLSSKGTTTFMARFYQDALDWACNPNHQTSTNTFRNMLICQPPAIAVELMCMSTTPTFQTKAIQASITNNDGITVGQLFDMVNKAKPIGGQVSLAYTLRSKA